MSNGIKVPSEFFWRTKFFPKSWSAVFSQVWQSSIFKFCVYKLAEAVRYLKFTWEFVIIGRGCLVLLKVARHSFSGLIPLKFERKLSRHKQRFGKINTTVVLDKDEKLLWSRLQWHRSCHSNEMTPLPILLATIFLGTGNCSFKIVYWSFFLQ